MMLDIDRRKRGSAAGETAAGSGARMSPLTSRTATEDRYAVAMGELWGGLARTLSRLDRLAAVPDGLAGDDVAAALRRLQYALHTASEQAYGLVPPSGAEPAHAELAIALGSARDATAEMAEAVATGGAEAAAMLVHEWRGALFRVRLARLRVTGTPKAERATPDEAEGPSALAPAIAFILALGGAIAFVVGATVGPWPAWVVGVAAVVASLLVYRP
jgi:hypothetical protein